MALDLYTRSNGSLAVSNLTPDECSQFIALMQDRGAKIGPDDLRLEYNEPMLIVPPEGVEIAKAAARSWK